MLLQTNSYIVPKERRAEHARLIRRFRQALARIGCDQFEVYEQVGANWSPGGANGRYVQIMRFRDRQHQQAVQAAERSDPGAQQIIAEFCELINFPYQHQHGYFATGFYTSVIPIGPRQAVEDPPQDGFEGQELDGESDPQGPATDEIDATEFEAGPAPVEQAAGEPEPEAEFELDAEPAPGEMAEMLPHGDETAKRVDVTANPDLLGEGDLRLELETAAEVEIAPESQYSQPHFASAETAFVEPAIPLTEPADDELLSSDLLPHEDAAAEGIEFSPEAPKVASAAAELFETQLVPADAPAEVSPEANLLPDSPEMWEASVVADMPAVEPGTLDESHPIDTDDLIHAESVTLAPVASDEFDPRDSGLIFDDEPNDEIAPTGAGELNDHAFAFDEPPPAGGRHETSSLYSAHDDLLPPALEPFGSNHAPATAVSAHSEHSADELLDDAHLIDNVAFPGAQAPTPKVHVAHEHGVHGIDDAGEKDADLLEFEAMIRDFGDSSAEHGKGAH